MLKLLSMYVIKKCKIDPIVQGIVQLTILVQLVQKVYHTGPKYWCNEVDVVQVIDLRLVENQILHEEAPSEQGSSVVGPVESSRHTGAPVHGGVVNTDSSPMYNFSLSFEELSNVGLDEPPRHSNPTWMVSISS